MTGKRELFEIIKTAVEAQGYFKEVDLFYNQFEQESIGRDKATKKPALLVEFADIQWESRAGGWQVGNTVVNFHMGIKWLRRDPGRIFEMEEKLQELLHVMNDYRVTLERMAENQNTDFEQMAVWTVAFTCQISDDTGAPTFIKKDPPTHLVINKSFVTTLDKPSGNGGFGYSFNFNL